jgi:hypothetical protein
MARTRVGPRGPRAIALAIWKLAAKDAMARDPEIRSAAREWLADPETRKAAEFWLGLQPGTYKRFLAAIHDG